MTFSTTIRRRLSGAMCGFGLLLPAAWGQKPTWVSFLVPGSIGTYPQSINNSMTVAGYYMTASGATHGFLRTPDGGIISFDPPGSTFTEPLSINDSGLITGTFTLSDGTLLSFVRSATGTFTTFGEMVPSFSSFAPQPVKINASGEVAGNYYDITGFPNSFTRSPSGQVTSYDFAQGADYPTITTDLANNGAVVGYSSNQSIDASSGFVSPPGGPGGYPPKATSIEAQGGYGTFPLAINTGGTVVGCFSIDENAGTGAGPALVFSDFMVAPNGTFMTLGVPGTVPSCEPGGYQSDPMGPPVIYGILPRTVSLNEGGTIVAAYTTFATHVQSGWIRTPSGATATFTVPGSTATTPTAMDNASDIAGYFTQSGKVLGFLRVAPTAYPAVKLTVEDGQGFFWDGGNSQRGTTTLQIYQDYPSTGQNWTWTPVPGGFTVCDLGICLSGSGSQVVMSAKADVFVITDSSAVLDITTGHYIQNPAKPSNAVYLSSGTTASPWKFSLTLH